MQKVSLASVIIGTLFIANSSFAADLAVKAPPPIAPVFSWTGCYIGAHLGGAWGDETVAVPSLLPGISVTGHTSGFLGGAQGGCNYQFGGNWLVGFEAEGSGADIKGDTTQTIFAITGTAHARTDWVASATGRLGWTWDRLLVYGKGGAAWAGNQYSVFIPVFAEQETASETRPGWTVGGGVEWAFLNNWSVKAEYDYYDFGTRTLTLVGTFAGAPIAVPGVEVRQKMSVAKLGVNYRFW
jgi:outer membrane immunogenic protein